MASFSYISTTDDSMLVFEKMSDSDPSNRCVMRGSCGTKGWFGQSLPCPDDAPPSPLESDDARALLSSVCGTTYDDLAVCCTLDQVKTLRERFNQVDSLISSCPACRNNFRSFFCSFTCSPQQLDFLNITSTQRSQTGEIAVKSVDFFVSEKYASGFFNSCKNVQFGATNGYAMDFLGGGAKNYSSFLKYLGDEKDLGSPFQIDFRIGDETGLKAYNPEPRNCADSDLMSRCACVDCPDICLSLPDVSRDEYSCSIGSISCFSLLLIVLYSLAILSFFSSYFIHTTLRNRREKGFERLLLTGETTTRSAEPGANTLSPDETDVSGSLGGHSHDFNGATATVSNLEDTLQPRQYFLNVVLRRFFYSLGYLCATSPWATFAFVFSFTALLNLGWRNFSVETDPVELWVARDSESKLQKNFFEENFGPFYKTEQLFITTSASEAEGWIGDSSKSVLSWNNLKWLRSLESDIRSLRSSPNNFSLDEVCFKPEGREGSCVIQSVTAWFEDLGSYDEDTWMARLHECITSPVDCRPSFGLPINPQFVLGGVSADEDSQTQKWSQARAMVVTYVINNSLDPEAQSKIVEWEETLRGYLEARSQEGSGNDLQISFSTGVSLEEELRKSTNTDVNIVVLSYLVMFLYITLTLGGTAAHDESRSFSSAMKSLFSGHHIRDQPANDMLTALYDWFRKSLVYSKFSLALFSIGLVLLSISSSVGLFSFLGVKTTLIIAEVIPFLVLAIGVDNIFLLVQELNKQNLLHAPSMGSNVRGLSALGSHTGGIPRQSNLFSEHVDIDLSSPVLSVEERVARAVSRVGPSILFGSIAETLAFALGALVPMPAVRNFAVYAAGSVFLNAILQLTVFIAALSVDLHRTEANRADCFPCLTLHQPISLTEDLPQSRAPSRMSRYIQKQYAPFITHPLVKALVLSFFGGMAVASIILAREIDLGLDQRLALPSDSYLIAYFDDLDEYYNVGPPLYFVVGGVDATKRHGQQQLCGRFTTCDDFSVANILEGERRRQAFSYVSQPTASWIDDYLSWLDPSKGSCCRVKKLDPDIFCNSRDSSRLCRPCLDGGAPVWNISMSGFPEGEEFMKYLQRWLISTADEECALGGQAAYENAISFSSDGSIQASHFRTYYSPLKSQKDFIDSFAAAHRIADEISHFTKAEVFPYSIFYIYFDQYAHIISITREILGLGLAAVLSMSLLFLGSWRASIIVTVVVSSIVLSIMGVMGIWGISLNAISLVNLVIALGISVEFCAHVARAFMNAGNSGLTGQKELDERVSVALADVGPSVVSGITMTKLIGISVLAFTRSRLLEMYYFRMWLTLIISGALHGLVLLPVILSLVGGQGYQPDETDESWMSIAIRRYGSEETPFLANYESNESDE